MFLRGCYSTWIVIVSGNVNRCMRGQISPLTPVYFVALREAMYSQPAAKQGSWANVSEEMSRVMLFSGSSTHCQGVLRRSISLFQTLIGYKCLWTEVSLYLGEFVALKWVTWCLYSLSKRRIYSTLKLWRHAECCPKNIQSFGRVILLFRS